MKARSQVNGRASRECPALPFDLCETHLFAAHLRHMPRTSGKPLSDHCKRPDYFTFKKIVYAWGIMGGQWGITCVRPNVDLEGPFDQLKRPFI
ncbi:MAG: hypothetical protein ACTS8S_03635 [Giesbergeria sp.]